jgi:hypothetical protein
MKNSVCRSGLMSIFLLLQGCYISCGDKVVFGNKNKETSLPGASPERGCVLKIERGKTWYPPEPSTVLF